VERGVDPPFLLELGEKLNSYSEQNVYISIKEGRGTLHGSKTTKVGDLMGGH